MAGGGRHDGFRVTPDTPRSSPAPALTSCASPPAGVAEDPLEQDGLIRFLERAEQRTLEPSIREALPPSLHEPRDDADPKALASSHSPPPPPTGGAAGGGS